MALVPEKNVLEALASYEKKKKLTVSDQHRSVTERMIQNAHYVRRGPFYYEARLPCTPIIETSETPHQILIMNQQLEIEFSDRIYFSTRFLSRSLWFLPGEDQLHLEMENSYVPHMAGPTPPMAVISTEPGEGHWLGEYSNRLTPSQEEASRLSPASYRAARQRLLSLREESTPDARYTTHEDLSPRAYREARIASPWFLHRGRQGGRSTITFPGVLSRLWSLRQEMVSRGFDPEDPRNWDTTIDGYFCTTSRWFLDESGVESDDDISLTCCNMTFNTFKGEGSFMEHKRQMHQKPEEDDA